MEIPLKKFNKSILVWLLLLPIWLNAQPPAASGLQYNTDGSVSFHYYNPEVKQVKILCDCELKQVKELVKTENLNSAQMQNDGNGWWHYTTPPLAPEFYTYQFRIKGRTLPDPTNPDSIRVNAGKRSVFVINGTPQTELYVSDTLYGQVDTLEFPVEGLVRRVLVYTPPGYHKESLWPVLYLLHGLNGNEQAWNNRAHAIYVLDKLICQKRAVPMVMVMPDANPNRLVGQDEHVGLFKNLMLYPTWSKQEFEQCFPKLDSVLSILYNISSDPEQRAAAGLSAGAKQSANLAKTYHSFHWIGLFSPVVNKKQIPDNCNTKIWIGAGQSDFFYPNATRFSKRLKKRNLPHSLYTSIGGHTWINWRQYFTEYVQIIFRQNSEQ